MSSHFNLKTLSFYAVAIGSVVILFNVVSAYGEANIKAPPVINGNYRLKAKNLPECVNSADLILHIQQSGIYLNGSLLPATNDSHVQTIAEEKPSLNGQLQNQQVQLSGSAPFLNNCNNPTVEMQGTVDDKNLQGTITLSPSYQKVEFIAEKVQETKQTEAQPKH
ncbi:MAG TPA: hypothetical protein V6D15_01405 [Oculatellaceae cyanobacterium]|jgi:hypothetical protein